MPGGDTFTCRDAALGTDHAVVVDAATVVVGATVAAGATVVAGTAVSELPPHPEATNRNVSATAYFLIAQSVTSSRRWTGATSEPQV